MVKYPVIILYVLHTIITAQIIPDSSNMANNQSMIEILKSDLKISFNTSINLFKSPYYFDKNDFLIGSFIISATGASMSLDDGIRADILTSRSRSMDKITWIGEKFGNARYGTALSGLLYSSGLIFNDKELRLTGQMLAEAIICNGIFTQLFKVTLGRARPYTGEPNTEIEPFEFEFSSSENSLPSGHTSTAFTIATVLSKRIDNIYASIALYSLASLTAYQRMYADMHWFSDTILGASIGTLIGLKIVDLHEENIIENSELDLDIFPQISPTGYGIGLALQF